jgi:hypothetical protein
MRKLRWTPEEDQNVKEQMLAGVPLEEVANDLGRTPSAVEKRLYLLRLARHRNGKVEERPADHLRRRPS